VWQDITEGYVRGRFRTRKHVHGKLWRRQPCYSEYNKVKNLLIKKACYKITVWYIYRIQGIYVKNMNTEPGAHSSGISWHVRRPGVVRYNICNKE
jgi:hypothetical protein